MAFTLDKATLEAALIGYEHELKRIESKMAELRQALRNGQSPAPQAEPSRVKAKQPKHHKMSEEGRARIAAAQRARWAKLKRA